MQSMKNKECSGVVAMRRTVLSGGRRHQGGFALLLTLVFLVLLTLLGVTSMQTSALEERMAGNARDRSVALQAGETTLRDAETAVYVASIWDYSSTCVGGLCSKGAAPDYRSYDWAAGTQHAALSKTVDANGLSSSLAEDTRYFVENVGKIKVSGKFVPTYRITSRATGQNANTRVFLQETYYIQQ